jgi:hypothetical protein
MSSRRSVRQLLVAVLLGVLVGGGLMAVTPAGAEVSSAVATNWKKIWKKNLKPLADKRYYKKSQSDAKYASKAESAASAAAAQAAANAATDSKLSGYYKKTETYSKAESDAKYAPYPTTVRGSYFISGTASAGGELHADAVSFGFNFSVAPAVEVVAQGDPATANCPGTVAAPKAAPGFVCFYEELVTNNTGMVTLDPDVTGFNTSGTFGLTALVGSGAAGSVINSGSWAATSGGSVSSAPKPSAADRAKAQELASRLGR